MAPGENTRDPLETRRSRLENDGAGLSYPVRQGVMRGARATVRKAQNKGREPLFLACPEWGHDLAYPVVQHLRALGKEPELIPGPEDVVGVVRALDGKPESLIVICHLGTTGAEDDARLRAVLERKGLLGERIMTVQLDSAPPSIIVEQINGRLQEDREPFEEVITQRVPEDVLNELAEEAVDEDEETRIGPAPTAPARRRRATQMGLAPPAIGPGASSASAPVERVIENPAATSFADGTMPRTPETLDDPGHEPAGPRRRSGVPKILLIVAMVVLLGLLSLVLLTLPGAEPMIAELRGDVPSAGDPSNPGPEVSAAGVQAAPGPREDEPGAEGGATVATPQRAPRAAKRDATEGAELTSTGADPEDSTTAAPAGTTRDGTGGGTNEPQLPDLDDGTASGPPAGGQQAEGELLDPIEVAIAENRLRRFQGLLVTREQAQKLDFEAAEAYCDGLSLAGFEDWELPDIGVLGTIGRARLVGKRGYWSSTTGDRAGNMGLIWSGKRRSIRALDKGWQRGRAVCVRDEP